MTNEKQHIAGNQSRNSDISGTEPQKGQSGARKVADDIKSGARDVAETVSNEAVGYAEKAKASAADEVKDVASALRTAAHEMRSGSPQERTLSQIADGLADVSDAVRGKDLGEALGDLNQFARHNPMVFLGGAALVGFAATRFAKASGSTGRNQSATYGARPGTAASSSRPYAATSTGDRS